MLTRGRKEFRIDIFSLSNQSHQFDLAIDEKFFESRENGIVDKGKGLCHLELDKSDTMLTLLFNIEAEIELTCDRSLDKFQYPLEIRERVIVKFGEEESVPDENLFTIKKDTQSIFVDDLIYELIGVAIPMKRLHPRFKDEEDTEEIVYTTETSSDPEESGIDPRWEALKNLKQ